jgi:hyperosmotically inducible protein
MRIRALPLLFVLLLPACRTNESPEGQVNDLEITASVKSKLAGDLGLTTVPNISVNSTNGVVTLSGQVDTGATKEKAEAIAKAVPHVVRVVDNLQITPAPVPPPGQ